MRAKRYFSRLPFLVTIFLALFLASNSWIQPAMGAEKLNISLIGLEAGFPEIRANVRILGEDNRVVENVDPADLEVYENGVRIDDFEIVPAQASPQIVAILVDSGINTTYERDYGDASMRLGLASLIDERILDTTEDKIILAEQIATSTSEETFIHLSAEDNPVRLGEALNDITFNPATNPTEAFLGIDQTLSLISSSIGERAGTPSSLVFVYHNVNWPPQTQQIRLASAMADKAVVQGTKIYVVHANPRQDFPEPFQEMASASGGQYIHLAADDVPKDRILEMFADLEPQSQTYVIRFKSNAIESGIREVAIVPAGEPISRSTATGSINVSSDPVSILVETTQDVQRSVNQSGDRISWTPTFIPVLAEVESWPYPLGEEDLELAELFVNGVPIQKIENPDPTNIVFDLDIDTIEIDSNLLLQVRISDRTGLVFKSDTQQVSITVEQPQPTATPTLEPDATAAPTEAVVVATPTPFVIVSSETGSNEMSLLDWLPWILTGILSLALVGMVILFNRRLKALGEGVAREAYKRGGLLLLTRTIITGPIRGNAPIARLKVLDGPDSLKEGKIDIFTHNVNIGRDPRRCDIVLYDGDENSSVSSLHAIIQFDQGQFKLTDASTNGTKLNGELLESDLPTPIKHNDKIILGDLHKRGARLRFEVVKKQKASKSAAEKAKSSLSNLNAVDEADAAEQIEVIDPKPTDTNQGKHSRQKRSNDENWMDNLE